MNFGQRYSHGCYRLIVMGKCPSRLASFIKMANNEVKSRRVLRGRRVLETAPAKIGDHNAREFRTALIKIARAGRNEREVEPSGVLISYVAAIEPFEDPKSFLVPRLTPAIASLLTSANGQRRYTAIIQALDGADPRRIRVCNCGRIYWAQRTDRKVFCSGNCRAKAWREENPQKWAAIQNLHEERRAKNRRSATPAATPSAAGKNPPARAQRAPRLPGSSKKSNRQR